MADVFDRLGQLTYNTVGITGLLENEWKLPQPQGTRSWGSWKRMGPSLR